jgi:hypothetical protein
MDEPTLCCTLPGSYCARIDALFNHDRMHVIDVGWRGDQLRHKPPPKPLLQSGGVAHLRRSEACGRSRLEPS